MSWLVHFLGLKILSHNWLSFYTPLTPKWAELLSTLQMPGPDWFCYLYHSRTHQQAPCRPKCDRPGLSCKSVYDTRLCTPSEYRDGSQFTQPVPLAGVEPADESCRIINWGAKPVQAWCLQSREWFYPFKSKGGIESLANFYALPLVHLLLLYVIYCVARV